VLASPAFIRDGGRTNGSPLVRDIRALETPKSTNPSRSRIRQPRWPNTGDSALSSKPPVLLTSERTPRSYHHPSHSASVVDTHSPSKDGITTVEPQSALLSAHSPSPTLTRLNRSRAPDPASGDLASMDHVPLSALLLQWLNCSQTF